MRNTCNKIRFKNPNIILKIDLHNEVTKKECTNLTIFNQNNMGLPYIVLHQQRGISFVNNHFFILEWKSPLTRQFHAEHNDTHCNLPSLGGCTVYYV